MRAQGHENRFPLIIFRQNRSPFSEFWNLFDRRTKRIYNACKINSKNMGPIPVVQGQI